MALLRSKRLVAATVAVVVVLGGAGAVLAGGFSRSSGPDRTYGTPNPFVEATASVHVVPIRQGSSFVTLHVPRRRGARWHDLRGARAPEPLRTGRH